MHVHSKQHKKSKWNLPYENMKWYEHTIQSYHLRLGDSLNNRIYPYENLTIDFHCTSLEDFDAITKKVT